MTEQKEPVVDPDEDEGFSRLLTFIAESRSIDFSGYKRPSLSRRIGKRMSDVGVASYDDYRDLLETSTEEFRSLFDTVLINVTSFFRDSPAWEFLRTEVVPELVALAGSSEEIRVWSAACSSGEEAYSLAMTLAEAIGAEEFRQRVKIYATDVDEDALAQARGGVYPLKALEPLAPELVDRYFEATGPNYAFRPDLRRKVIFGRHDITHDAPISRLHILSCRNTLMYFNAETQAQILDRFHFALRDEGILLLGKAEMLLSDSRRFEPLSVANRVFRRRAGAHAFRPATIPATFDLARGAAGTLRQRQLRDIALEINPMAHVVVDVNGTVMLVNNQARALFGVTTRDEGRPLRDLEISYRPVELRSLIEQAQAERRVVRITAERRLGLNDAQFLDVVVQPLVSDDGIVLGVDITFIDTTAFVRLQEEAKRASQDLEAAYEELQSTNEELETTNEELQSSIEELETTNEELQSTNEELETTNEELQSSNEELETMNEELRARTAELDEVAEYLESVLVSVPAGIVVLDAELRVRSWNHRAEELWGLREQEVAGARFFSLDFGLPTPQLHGPVAASLSDGGMRQLDIDAVNRLGRRVLCSVTITTLGPRGAGVVLSMEDRSGS